jgi:ParB family transcriptional regulator, chromosome partitioning protein
VLAALDTTAVDKLTGFALRLTSANHIGIPDENQSDLLAEAEAAFAPPQPKTTKSKSASKSEEAPALVKAAQKKAVGKKQSAA